MHALPLKAVLFWIAVALAPPDTSQIVVKGPGATWAWTRQTSGWSFSADRSAWSVAGKTVTTSIKGEKPGVEDLARYVEGIKDHDWKKSATLKLQDASLAKKGEAWVYTLDEGTAAPERYVIRFRCKSAARRAFPGDAKLTEAQRLFCQWDAKTFGLPDPARWSRLSAEEKTAAEDRFLEQLSSDQESQRVEAIDALVGLGSKKAVSPILQIAAERKEKNNWDRHTACRALGMLGDQSVVPELVHLTYHYNWNTRQWAQISLLRLTGQNFGRDVAAWRQWWQKQGGKPPISGETVVWATSPRLLSELEGAEDPNKQEELDRQAMETIIKARKPQIVSLTPPNGAKDVDPAVRELRVRFDVPMAKGFSWTGGGSAFPKSPEGKGPFWSEDRKTCALPVKLEPGHEYRLGLNSPSFQNFQSAAGIPLEPVVYSFKTRDK